MRSRSFKLQELSDIFSTVNNAFTQCLLTEIKRCQLPSFRCYLQEISDMVASSFNNVTSGVKVLFQREPSGLFFYLFLFLFLLLLLLVLLLFY